MSLIPADWRIFLDKRVTTAIRELEDFSAWPVITEAGAPATEPQAWYELPVPRVAISRLGMLRGNSLVRSWQAEWAKWEEGNPIACANLTLALFDANRRPPSTDPFVALEIAGKLAPRLAPEPNESGDAFFRPLDPEDRASLEKSIASLRKAGIWPKDYIKPIWGEVVAEMAKLPGYRGIKEDSLLANISRLERRTIPRWIEDRMRVKTRPAYERWLKNWTARQLEEG